MKRIDRTEINTAALTISMPLLPGADTGAEQKALVRALLDSISAFLTNRANRWHSNSILPQHLKPTLQLPKVSSSTLILRQPAAGSGTAFVLLSDDFVNPVTPGNYPDQYGAVRLLSKMIVIINAFNPGSTDLDWYLQNSGAMGWFEIDGIPWDRGTGSCGF
jgi:hypothetical protein